MLMGLVFLVDFASMVDLLTKNPVTAIKSFLFAGAIIFCMSAISDPMPTGGRILCVFVALVLLGIFAFMVAKSVQLKREVEAAQMPDASAT